MEKCYPLGEALSFFFWVDEILWTDRTGIGSQVNRRDREENKDKRKMLPVVISALAS